jgi:hypothetical protein
VELPSTDEETEAQETEERTRDYIEGNGIANISNTEIQIQVSLIPGPDPAITKAK